MRELKFRVWSKDQKTYNYKFPYNSIGDFYVSSRGKVFSDFGNTVVPEVRQESFIVEQYTGLKDKNGKEIYEGDIVKCNDCVREVFFNPSEASFMFKNDRLADSLSRELFYSSNSEYEIIGNIHENPELLRRKNECDSFVE